MKGYKWILQGQVCQCPKKEKFINFSEKISAKNRRILIIQHVVNISSSSGMFHTSGCQLRMHFQAFFVRGAFPVPFTGKFCIQWMSFSDINEFICSQIKKFMSPTQ